MTPWHEKPSWRRIDASHCAWSSGQGCAACGADSELLSSHVGHPITSGREPFLVICNACFGDMQDRAYRMHDDIVHSHYNPGMDT